MRKSKFSESQIVGIFKDAESASSFIHLVKRTQPSVAESRCRALSLTRVSQPAAKSAA